MKPALHAPLAITAFTDRIYPATTATCVIHDPAWRRRLIVGKANSNTTVVFNPWKEMADLDANDWHEFLCVEAVNAAANKVTLPSGKTHTMQAHVAIEPLKARQKGLARVGAGLSEGAGAFSPLNGRQQKWGFSPGSCSISISA